MSTASDATKQLIRSEYDRAKKERKRAWDALSVADAELRHWLGLMKVHRLEESEGHGGSLEVSNARVDTTADTVTLVPNAAGKTGMSDLIRDILRVSPAGLEAGELIRRVEERTKSDAPNARKNLRSMLNYLVSHRKLTRRDGRYFLAQE